MKRNSVICFKMLSDSAERCPRLLLATNSIRVRMMLVVEGGEGLVNAMQNLVPEPVPNHATAGR